MSIIAMINLAAALALQETPTVLDDILVSGRQSATRDYVASIAHPRNAGQVVDQIARWETQVCVRVIGLPREHAALIEQEVTDVLNGMRVPVASGRCVPNAVITITDQPEIFAKAFARQHNVAFFGNSAARRDAFGLTDRPSRWIHRIVARGDEARGSVGIGLSAQQTPSGPTPVGRSILNSGLPTVVLPNARLTLSTSARIDRAMIVLDADVVATAPRQALVEYIAYVTAVDLGPDFDRPKDGVLALIGSDGIADPSAILTERDRNFVRALYTSDARRSASEQERQIANLMLRPTDMQ